MQQGGQSLSSYQWPNSLSRVAYFGQYPDAGLVSERGGLV
jgi:hypothetical protein